MKPTITCLALQPAVATDHPTTVQLLVKIEAPKVSSPSRPSLNLGLALDCSGSMIGEPIQRLKQAAGHLCESLKPDDLLSAVSFSGVVTVLADAHPVSRQHRLLSTLNSLQANGSTDLYNGISLAAAQVFKAHSQRQIDRVILLTDGCPTAGITQPEILVECAREWKTRGVSLTAVGLGDYYNEDLLSELAGAGGGNFFHIDQADEIGPFFQLELQGISRTFARNLKLRIKTAPGVQLIRVLNILKKDEHGALALSDLVRGVPNEVVLELQVPPQQGINELAEFHLEYREVAGGYLEGVGQSFRLPAVPNSQLTDFPLNIEVSQKRAVQLAANYLQNAVRKLDSGNRRAAEEVVEQGLRVLDEANPSPEIANYVNKLKTLKAKIAVNEVASARKMAHYGSVSMSQSGLGDLLWFKEFLALPESQRTPERLQQMATRSLGA